MEILSKDLCKLPFPKYKIVVQHNRSKFWFEFYIPDDFLRDKNFNIDSYIERIAEQVYRDLFPENN
jgi:hypothetical protein